MELFSLKMSSKVKFHMCPEQPMSFILSVLSGSSADTPIEEFTPTPAFPALQYLESVDEGGVAWKAGLRTGDFLIEVRVQLGLLKTLWRFCGQLADGI